MDLLQHDLWLYLAYTPRLSFVHPSVDFLLGQGLIEVPKNLPNYNRDGWSYRVTEAGKAALKALEMVDVFVLYSESWEEVRPPSETDEWDRGTESANSRFEAATLEKTGMYGFSKDFRMPKAFVGRELTLVWCHYGTGDTFGHTYGKFGVGNVYTTPEGRALIEHSLTRDHDDYFGGVEDFFEETVVLTQP